MAPRCYWCGRTTYVAIMNLSFIYVVSLLLGRVHAANGDDQARLLKVLFDKYDKEARPVCESDETVTVRIGIGIRQIMELDEPKQILTLNVWLRLVWNDCRLRWNVSEYGGLKDIVIPVTNVWAPDITLYDNTKDEIEGMKKYMTSIDSSGTCSYNFPSVINVLCRIDVTSFPFDTQVCPIMFGSWAFHSGKINTTKRDENGQIDNFIENAEWDIVEVPAVYHSLKYACCAIRYSDVTFYLMMKRKPLYYVINLLFPCMLITAVALLGFLLPPDAGEKVALEITVLLSLSVFSMVVSESLPASAENFPIIGLYFASALGIVAVSTFFTVVVLHFHHRGTLNKPVPKWIRTVVFQHLGKMVFYKVEPFNMPAEVKSSRNRNSTKERNSSTKETYINGYQASRNGTVSNSKDVHIENNIEASAYSRPWTVTPLRGNNVTSDPPCFLLMLDILKQQLLIMENEKDRRESKIKHDHLSVEWKRVGIILDRLFLILFALLVMISSLTVVGLLVTS